MGSSISLNKVQIICIIKREIETQYKEKELNKCQVNDYGILNYETFDDEEQFNNQIEYLNNMLKLFNEII